MIKMLFILAGLLFSLMGNAAQEEVIIKSARVIEPFQKQVPFEIDLGQKGTCEAKLAMNMGLPTVMLTINNEGPFKFLVDTGADLSIISRDFVKTLKLTAAKNLSTTIYTSQQKATIETTLYILDEIKLGDAIIRHAPFVASNTAEDDFSLLHDLQIVGILGANIFHDVILNINLGQLKMSLSQHTEHELPGAKLDLDKGYYIPVVKAKVHYPDKSKDYHFLIDTGYTGFIKMPVCFPEHQRKEQHVKVVNYDLFNEQQGGFIAELDGTFVLGERKLENPLVKYNIGHCENPPKWGLIGTGLLQHQEVSIDQKHRQIIIH